MGLLSNRPYDSSFLTIAAGAFILAMGIIALTGYFAVGDHSTADLIEILIGTAAAAGIIITGILLLLKPDRHRMLGAVILILSVATFSGTSGGLYIGVIGTFLGGIMSITWHQKNSKSVESGNSS